MNRSDYDVMSDALLKAKHLLIGSHVSPDGDAIGSSLALALALEAKGKKVTVFNVDGVPFNLSFLKSSARVCKTLPKNADYDLAVMVDCATPDRVGGDFEGIAKKISTASIDHHFRNEKGPGVHLIETNAAATGEIVTRLLIHMKAAITKDIAENLYCALVVDTGFFRYSNTTEKTFQLAADLVKWGAKPEHIAQELEENYPAERFHLLGAVLATLDVHRKLGYATIVLTQKMMSDLGVGPEMAEDLANLPRAIAGISVAALFREKKDGGIKVSLRSKTGVDVSVIARGFDGGGHIHAAGFTLHTNLETAKQQVLEKVQQLRGRGFCAVGSE